MPKLVDHESRRRTIADALWQVVGREGFEGATLRRVAAQAGVSMGLVQHYFHTKDQMLMFALDSMEERITNSFSASLAQLPAAPCPRALVRALVIELLPVDETRRTEGHSLYALLAGTLHYPELGDRLRSGVETMQTFVTEQIAEAGMVPHPEQSAAGLLALVDGLAAHLFAAFVAPDDAVAILDTHLDMLFGQ